MLNRILGATRGASLVLNQAATCRPNPSRRQAARTRASKVITDSEAAFGISVQSWWVSQRYSQDHTMPEFSAWLYSEHCNEHGAKSNPTIENCVRVKGSRRVSKSLMLAIMTISSYERVHVSVVELGPWEGVQLNGHLIYLLVSIGVFPPSNHSVRHFLSSRP